MRPEDRIRERAAALKAVSRWREPVGAPEDPPFETGSIHVDARSNDYLGLARRVVSRETDGEVTAGAGASRLISGTLAEHVELEAALAEWLQSESALLFSSGFAANLGAVSALAAPDDVVFSDALNHASLIDGCRLGKGRVVVVPHLDLGALEAELVQASTAGARWVVTESYFGMDGDVPDLRALRRLCDDYEAGLIVDEAHALGVFGVEGRGLCAEAGVKADLLIGGMGKGLGVQGGFAAGSRTVRAWLWNRARSFVYSTAPSPLICRLALEQLRHLREADGARLRLRELELRLERDLNEAGVPLARGRRGPLFPIVFGTEDATLKAAGALLRLGISSHAIRPPTVPPGSSRLRVTLRADLSDEQVQRLGAGLVEVWKTASVTRPFPIGPAEPRLSSRPAGAAPPLEAHYTAPPRSAPAPTAGGPRRWIVLGTGTDVGKSFVAAALVRLVAARGWPVAGLKPIETGLPSASESGPHGDAARLQAASFHVKHPHPHPLFGFGDPVTPSLAARRASSSIELECVRPWLEQVRTEGTEREPTLVIETAGGVFSPLNDLQDNLDLAVTLGPAEWILVAPDRLGSLHDVLSALRAMESAGRVPDWLVLSAVRQPDASSGTNAAELRRRNIKPRIISLGLDETAPLEAILEPHYPAPPSSVE